MKKPFSKLKSAGSYFLIFNFILTVLHIFFTATNNKDENGITNNKDIKINDPNWVQVEDTLWEKKYTDNKYIFTSEGLFT